MSLTMILALTVCPAMLGIQESIQQNQSKARREQQRARRCNLIVSCVKPSLRSRDVNQRMVVLKDGRLYIDTDALTDDRRGIKEVGEHHPVTSYFLPYPDESYEGYVTTIQPDPPVLNWIYVDKETHQMRYGVRADAQDNVTGPFDCTSQERRLTIEGWEGFVVVEEYPGIWALYFDRDDNGLAGKIPFGSRVLEVELTRRETKREKPAEEAEDETLDQRFASLQRERRKEEAVAGDTESHGEQQSRLDDLMPALERLSASTSEILNAYSGPAENTQLPEDPMDGGADEYVPLFKESPTPGLTIELGARRPKKRVAFDGVSGPPASPTASATSAGRSMWSTRPEERGPGTPASSVDEDGETRLRQPRLRPPSTPVLRKPSGVGLTPKGYKKPQVEDVTDTVFLKRWPESDDIPAVD